VREGQWQVVRDSLACAIIIDRLLELLTVLAGFSEELELLIVLVGFSNRLELLTDWAGIIDIMGRYL